MKIIDAQQGENKFITTGAIVCIGMFDGVHYGHQHILSNLRSVADRNNTQTVAITFSRHPAGVLRGLKKDFLLNPPRERKERLAVTGKIDYLYEIPYNETIASLSPETFLETWVYPNLEIKTFLVGHDFHFGKNRLGDIHTIEQQGEKKGFDVIAVKEVLKEGKKISSTTIRNDLKNKRIEKAKMSLGYDYMVRGEVVQGEKRGRKIGFPTANILLEDEAKLLPCNGVYKGTVRINTPHHHGKEYTGMMNIGLRPTVSSKDVQVTEVHILGFNDNIYGAEISVYLKRFLREEKKFESLDQLVGQLKKDRAEVLRF